MKTVYTLLALFLMLSPMLAGVAAGHEFSGYIALDGRAFVNDPLFPDQKRHNASFAFQPEYYHEWENGSSFIFVPFARIDSADSERNIFDIRELNILFLADQWELRVGIGKVFWGVSESQHLVDIINQTDLVDSTDGEEKLGQPMVHLSLPRDWGVMDLFVLPYFRERTFAGEKGRLRGPLVVDTSQTGYESSAREHHLDLSFRYSHTLGNWDLGLSHFYGTDREPTLIRGTDPVGDPVLIPFYEIIHQTGLDLQLVAGRWLWKLESIYRSGQGDQDFLAFTGGFEYSLTNIFDSSIDLGLISEWLFDERGQEATTAFDNDIMLAARIGLNDAAGTEILMGLIQDIDSTGRLFTLESSRRIGDQFKISIESFFVLDSSEEGAIHSLREDDYLQVSLAYYF